MAPELKTQGPIKEDWVKSTKYVPICATKAMKLEGLRSSHNLRKSLKRVDLSVEEDEGASTTDDCKRGSILTTTTTN